MSYIALKVNLLEQEDLGLTVCSSGYTDPFPQSVTYWVFA